jgi:hypothetical protein
MREIWPNFFLVGAAKAGTTSIYAYLSQHPRIFFPAIKEPHFFTQVHPSNELRFLIEAITKRSVYLRLFSPASNFEVIGDASPSYLWCPEAPQRIHEVAPNAKIAIILRDPLQRAYSHYLMDYREGAQHRQQFYEALLEDMNQPEKGWGITYLYYELGLYAEQVRRYLENFGHDRVKILLFEQFRRDVKGALRELAYFLEVDPAPLDSIDTSKLYNAYAAPRNQLMRRLAGAKLSRIIGQNLVPRRIGAYIFERFFLKPAVKPPLDERARELLCTLYDPELDRLERIMSTRLPELRLSWSQKSADTSVDSHPVIAGGSE